jgi:hypothetical protein
MDTIRTTLVVPEKLWKQFTLKVIEKHGNRMNSAVIIKFIENYVKMNK